MKKTLSILLSVILLFSIMTPVTAAIEMDNIKVTAFSFDNTIFNAYQKVTITSDSIDFTKYTDTLTIELSGTTKESIKNIRITDSGKIEFDMMTYGVPEGLYSVILRYKDGIIPMEQWAPSSITVKEGHFMFEDEPAILTDILKSGITVKFYNVGIESQITAMIDDIKVDCTKVTDRIFKLYPPESLLSNKDNISVRLIVPNGYYERSLRIIEGDVYLESESYSREEPFSFYINSKVTEFPLNKGEIKVTITGNSRYIEVTDLNVYNNHKIRAYTPLPLATGTYQMSVSFTGSAEIYRLEFEVVTPAVKMNSDLDSAVLDFLTIDGKNIKLTLFDNQILRYVESASKVIDLTSYEFDQFTLDLRNDALLLLINKNSGLTIALKDYQIVITKQSLEAISTRDAYIIIEKKTEFPVISVNFFETSDNLYIDSNILNMKVFSVFNELIKNYERAETLYVNQSGTLTTENAYLMNNLVYFSYQNTGTYKMAVFAKTFSDVSSNYWGLKYIAPLTTVGIIDGMGGGIFAPEGQITRAQFAKLIAVSTDLPTGDNLSYFQDVFTSDWYYQYVVALEKAAIVSGDFFQANKAILRKDMAVMIMKAYEHYTKDNIQQIADNSMAKFSDIGSLTSEEVKCILAAQHLGIIEGMTLSTYAPNSTATRAQAAAIIYRLMKVLELL